MRFPISSRRIAEKWVYYNRLMSKETYQDPGIGRYTCARFDNNNVPDDQLISGDTLLMTVTDNGAAGW